MFQSPVVVMPMAWEDVTTDAVFVSCC